MLNNKNMQSEFKRFLEGPKEKLKLASDKTICIKYEFFVPNDCQEAIVDFLSTIAKSYSNLHVDYELNETSKKPELDSTKVKLYLLFQNVPLKQQECFSKIAGIFFPIKLAIDNYAYGKFPKAMTIYCSFFIKRLEKYNNIKVKFEGENGEVEEYLERLLPSKYTKYTKDINYDIETYTTVIRFEAYCGNIENVGLSELYFEIANNIISFNNIIVKGIKG